MHRLIKHSSPFSALKSIVRQNTESIASMVPSSKRKGSDGRRPLTSLQTYPALAEHEPTLLPDISKSSEPIGKPIPPPKPAKSPRTCRVRSGSAPASVLANILPNMSTRLEQPYKLQRSNSSQPKIPRAIDYLRRGRSYSSSAVASYASTTSTSNSGSIDSLVNHLNMRRHKYGETHPKVGSAWNRIGNYFFRACQYSRALDAFKHAVYCYPVEAPELACSYSNVGAVYWASGKPDKAITFLEQALEIYELHEISPDESMAVASTLYQMGLCNTLRKQYGEALACLKRCQKIQASVLPPRDIQVGRTLDAIGKVHFFKEEYSTALQCHEEARRIKSASCNNESAVVTSLLNIAAVHHATKNWNVALKNYTKVMDLQKSELVHCRNQKGQPLLARAAQEVGETMQLMGDLHRQMDQMEQSGRFYKEASLLYEQAGLPQDDPRMMALN